MFIHIPFFRARLSRRIFSCSALFLVALFCISCDHPYALNADIVAAVDNGVASVSVASCEISVNSSAATNCVIGTSCVVTLDIANSRSVDIVASVSRADETLASAPVVLEARKNRVVFSFTPSVAAKDRSIAFTVSLAIPNTSRAFPSYTMSVPCKSPTAAVATYSIAYDANGGAGSLPPSSGSSYAAGSSVSLESAVGLSRSGFSFGGWNTQADGGGTSYAAGATLIVSSNVTLYAQWKIVVPTYVVVYDANGASGTVPAVSGSSYASGSTVGVEYAPGLSLAGYAFNGWNTAANGSGTAYAAGSTIAVSGNVTLYAQWVAVIPTYSVSYELNGGSGSIPSLASVASGTAVVVDMGSALSRSGYSFDGWNTTADGSGTTYAAGTTLVVSADVTLYAQWSIILPSYTVTYDANGGSGSLPADSGSSHTSGSTITVGNGSGLVRSGYAFSGWNTAQNGTGAAYAPGSSLIVDSEKTLYAQWNSVLPSYTVAYDANGGSGTLPVDSGTSYTSGSTITVGNGSGLSRAGYTFSGWNTAANGSGTAYAENATFVISSDTTLYAQWLSVLPSYAVTYNANGGSGSLPADSGMSYSLGTSITVGSGSGLSLSGYLFTGWNTASGGSGSPYAAGASLTVSSDTTLYAQWSPANSVTFNANGGTGSVSAVTGMSGSAVILPDSTGFSYSGKAFVGWNTSADGTGSAYAAGANVTLSSDIALYAQWMNASLASCLANIPSGGSFALTGELTANEFTELRNAVFGATSGVSLDLVGVTNSTLSDNLFSGCANLSSVALPSSLNYLPLNCFKNCTSLTTLILNSGLQGIAQYAVRGCTALTALTIPASVSVLEPYCFYNSGLGGNSGVLTFEQADYTWYYEGSNTSQACYFGSTSTDIYGYSASPKNTNTFTIRVPPTAVTNYGTLPLMSRYTSNIVGFTGI